MPFGTGPLYSEATQQLVNRLKEVVIRCHLGQEAQAHAAGISEHLQKISHCPQKACVKSQPSAAENPPRASQFRYKSSELDVTFKGTGGLGSVCSVN